MSAELLMPCPAAGWPSFVCEGMSERAKTGRSLDGVVRALGVVRSPGPRAGSLRRLAGLEWLVALAFALAAALPVTLARAVEIEVPERPVLRDVIALYDSASEGQPHLTRVHQFAEMPLNHLGYRVTYQDVAKPLPDPATLARHRAVLTWFLEPMRPETGATVVHWLEAVTGRGLRHIVLGDMAPGAPEAATPGLVRLHERIGLGFANEYVDITFKARVVAQDKSVIGFERPLDKVLPDFPVLPAISGKVDTLLAIESPTRDGIKASTVVATSAGGGFAAQGFTIYYEPATDRIQWVLNPFAFFRRALGDERMPIPDATTLAGRRIYFSHIDGDGWNNLTEIEPYREQERLSAEVVAEELLIPYPDLPVSVGVIAGDMLPHLGGSSAAHAVARLIYALPQVEVASHTYSHPYNWSFFERYDRAAENEAIMRAARPQVPLRERFVGTLAALTGREPPRGQYNPYVAGTDDLPRTYLKEPFDLGKEVAGALHLAESFAPKGKRARLYQWSGDTTPFDGAIAATRQAGVRNINGGDSRFDRSFPSVAYVPPIARPSGTERQIYAGNSNENTYTNDWTGPYYGFFLLEETLKNTETPRRLKPFNVYYHMYSGEKQAALSAVKHFLDLARQSDVIPLAASEYAAIADDFFGVEMREAGKLAWEVLSRGSLQTVRFDEAAGLSLDPERSRGVLGSTRHLGSLYVSLDPAEAIALVALTERTTGEADVAAGRFPMLVSSRWQVRDRRTEECGLAVTAQGFGTGDMTWQTRPGRAFAVSVERGERVLSREIVRADQSGLFELSLEPDATEPLSVRLVCHE